MHRSIHDQNHRAEFERLTRAEQIAAVRRLADQGFSDYGISQATGWHVEQIRRVLAERETGS